MNGATIYFSIHHSECAGTHGLDSPFDKMPQMLEKSNQINNMILMSIILPRHNSYSACDMRAVSATVVQPLLVEVLPFLNLLTSSHDLSRSPPHFDVCFLQPLVSISPNSKPPRLVVCIHATHSSANLPCKRYHGRAPTSSRPASLSLRTCL